MTSEYATPEQIFGGLGLDPAWEKLPETVKQAMSPYISAIPQTLAAHLDKPVTVRTWAEARLAYLKHLLAYGYAEALCDCEQSENQTPDFVRSQEQALRDSIILLEQLLEGVEEVMDLTEQTDHDILTGPSVGLRGLARLMFERRLLTIADLLKLQPLLLLSSN